MPSNNTSLVEQPGLAGPATTRRSVLRAAAWSAPVVAVAVATPFAAATTTTLTLEPVETGAVVLAGQPATVSVRVLQNGVALPSQSVTFTLVSPGWATLSSPTATAGPDGIASIVVTPTSSNQVLTVQATAGTSTTPLTVVVQRPRVTITSAPITDPTIANDLTFTGEGFYNLTDAGANAYANGIYWVINEVGGWDETVPLPGTNLDQGWITSWTWGLVNGAFTATITIAANRLESGKQYVLATAAAHGNSQIPQFHSQSALFSVA